MINKFRLILYLNVSKSLLEKFVKLYQQNIMRYANFFCWTDRCFRLRHKVQDLLDQELMNFETNFKLNGFKKSLLHKSEVILYIEIGMTIGLTLEERRERFL